MYDNLILKLRNFDVPDIDFLGETSNHFNVSGEYNFNDEIVLSGSLDNEFKLTIKNSGIKISGSLCKYYLGDNFQTLGRGDTKRAIEKLSDTLHLPIEKATVSRLDVAQNFIVKQQLENYYNHFGKLKNGWRSPVTNDIGKIETIYYYQSNGLLIFYDKVKEQTVKRQPIPELYQDRNVLRYEQRYTKRLPKAFNVERVTASLIYGEKFYIDVIDKWKDNYFNIQKLNDITFNFEAMRTKTDLYNLGVLALVDMAGGELNFISQMQEAQRNGILTRKQSFDIKQAVTSACKERIGITAKNDCILELDKKVVEAVKFYR